MEERLLNFTLDNTTVAAILFSWIPACICTATYGINFSTAS